MEFSNLTGNISLNFTIPGQSAANCLKDGALSAECVYKTICPQFSDYFVRMGITAILVYVLGTVALWAYFRYLNDRMDWDGIYKAHPELLKIADMRTFEGKYEIDTFVRDKLSKFLLGYCIVVVYLSIYPL